MTILLSILTLAIVASVCGLTFLAFLRVCCTVHDMHYDQDEFEFVAQMAKRRSGNHE